MEDLYVVREMGTGRVKIGRTGNLAARLATLRCAGPNELRVLLYVPDAGWLERTLHEAFSDQHVSNEWFECQGNVIRFLQQCADKAAEPWVKEKGGLAAHHVLSVLGDTLSGALSFREFFEKYPEMAETSPFDLFLPEEA